MEYTINREQKQALTGVRNELWRKLQTMNPATMAITYRELEDLVERLEKVVQPMDEIDNHNMEVLIDYYGGCAREHGFSSAWSMWEDPEGQQDRVWMISDHPYGEDTVIEYDASMGNGKTYQVTIEGPLWIDVWKACEKLIELSTDSHHRYIEDLRERDGVLVLITGS